MFWKPILVKTKNKPLSRLYTPVIDLVILNYSCVCCGGSYSMIKSKLILKLKSLRVNCVISSKNNWCWPSTYCVSSCISFFKHHRHDLDISLFSVCSSSLWQISARQAKSSYFLFRNASHLIKVFIPLSVVNFIFMKHKVGFSRNCPTKNFF